MLLKDNKKGLVTIIMSKMKDSDNMKTESYNASKGAELDNSSSCEKCAKDVLDAIEAKSPKRLASSLKELMKMLDEEEDYKEDMSKSE
jgi:hypothetical protein